MKKSKTNIKELFDEKTRNGSYLNVAAPMVRYTKLEFRKLLRKYNTQLCFTPMIVADSFCRSEDARNSEFTTSLDDTPLIAQFAVKDSTELQTAAELVYPFTDGVDINCGCPQSWAIAKSYGCGLLRKPEVIQDMIKSVKRLLPNEYSCSVKMRILQKCDLRSTIDLCQKLEHCGASFLSIHARTPRQKTSEPVNIEAIKEIKKSLQIPLIYNGDVRSVQDANEVYKITNCDGIMSARGILTNPTLYMGTQQTTLECMQDWVNICTAADSNVSFQCFHHHLTFMMEKLTKKKIRAIFNNYTKKDEILSFMKNFFNITPQKNSVMYENYKENYVKCYYDTEICDRYKIHINESIITSNESLWNEKNNGKYFLSYQVNLENDYYEDLSFMGSSIFD